MTDEDALIELLNGFGNSHLRGKFDTDVFLDEDGMPTDRFLQALKADMTALPAVDDTTDFSFTRETTRKLDQEFRPDRKPRKLVTDNEYFDGARLVRRGVQFNDDDHEEQSWSDQEYPEPVRTRALTEVKRKVAKAPKQKKKSVQAKSSIVTTAAERIADKTTASSSLKQRHAYTTGPVSNSILGGSAGPQCGGNVTASAAAVDEVHFPRAVGIDTTEIEVEAESRVKSLQLRVQGQLQTIRSLESQLSDALQLVEARNKQLAHCNARLKATTASAGSGPSSSAAAAARTTGVTGAPGVTLRSEAAAAKATELAEQYKVRHSVTAQLPIICGRVFRFVVDIRKVACAYSVSNAWSLPSCRGAGAGGLPAGQAQ
jgi:uncharacterized coiled-coil protein SlyX